MQTTTKPLFTLDEYSMLCEISPNLTRRGLKEFIKETFPEKNLSDRQIIVFIQNHQSDLNLQQSLRTPRGLRHFTQEQKQRIFNECRGMDAKEIQKFIQDEFGINLTITQIRDWSYQYPSFRAQMKKCRTGQIPGKENPHRPLGAVIVDAKGYQSIKLSSGVWKKYSQWVWENAHGYTEKRIIHLDGDGSNNSLDNLMAVSSEAWGYVTSAGQWAFDDPELMRARFLAAEIKATIQKKKKERKEQKNV